MQKSGVCDTRCQLFYNEIAKREHALRTKWFIANKQRLIDNLESEKFKRQAYAVIQNEEAKQKKKQEEDRLLIEKYRKRETYPEWRPKIDNTIPMDYMKPIKPEVRSILYEKNSRSFDAKNEYLKERYKDPPENRFYYPDCSSWIYGWHLNDFLP